MKKLTVLLSAAILFAAALCAQVRFPDTPAGRQFSAWLAAFNSGDRATMQQYMENAMPGHDLDRGMALRSQTGGFDVKKVETSDVTTIVVLAQERGPLQRFLRITMKVAAAEPHIVEGNIVFAPAEAPPEFAPPRMTPAEQESARHGLPFQKFSEWLDAFNSAGGGYSTVGDLLKFADALMAHKLLNAEYTGLLIKGKVDSGGGRMYAYGFEDERKGGVGAVGHGGGAPGMNGDLRIYPSSGYVVAVLANLDPPAAQQVSGFIDARLPR